MTTASRRARPAHRVGEDPVMPYSAQTFAALLAGVIAGGFVLVAGGALGPPAGGPDRPGTARPGAAARRPAAAVTAPPPPSAVPAPTPDPFVGPAGQSPPDRLPNVTPRPGPIVAPRTAFEP